MTLLSLIGLSLAAPTTILVGVPGELGSTRDLQITGGSCAVHGSTLRCEADRAITLRWPGDRGELVGDIEVSAGSVGRVFVLAGAPGAGPRDLHELLEGSEVDRHDLVALRMALVGTSAEPAPWPDRRRFEQMHQALDHPDPRVRAIAVEAWQPWVSGTPFDPLPIDAPSPLRPARLARLLQDPHPSVRRRALHLLRSARSDLDTPALAGLYRAAFDDPHPSVQALAFRSMRDAIRRGLILPGEAWDLALSHAPSPMPAGRAACNQLARLEPEVRRLGVDLHRAMDLCLEHHPERAWAIATAWHRTLPAEERWIRPLLHDTLGLSKPVLQRWHTLDPELVERLLRQDWPEHGKAERRDLAIQLIYGSP